MKVLWSGDLSPKNRRCRPEGVRQRTQATSNRSGGPERAGREFFTSNDPPIVNVLLASLPLLLCPRQLPGERFGSCAEQSPEACSWSASALKNPGVHPIILFRRRFRRQNLRGRPRRFPDTPFGHGRPRGFFCFGNKLATTLPVRPQCDNNATGYAITASSFEIVVLQRQSTQELAAPESGQGLMKVPGADSLDGAT
jgi:hypothetical protein